ncbi:hypothetical protein EJ06DRAFT_526342 [Trichodelitschia bisporula]|uniref:Uncharacterized protein n=1 Tax=Trichodelitschia bisporula TaxID=703511 RepID=A0A6G1I864_9PEZI|nr:hypothetical protein EJ06DRAFT_526342 [Trichodelitschia bisporula]
MEDQQCPPNASINTVFSAPEKGIPSSSPTSHRSTDNPVNNVKTNSPAPSLPTSSRSARPPPHFRPEHRS